MISNDIFLSSFNIFFKPTDESLDNDVVCLCAFFPLQLANRNMNYYNEKRSPNVGENPTGKISYRKL